MKLFTKFMLLMLLILIEFLTNTNLDALDWPVKSSQMIASFGSIHEEELLIGVIFEHEGDSISSVSDGEKVFLKNFQSYSSVPLGHGSLIIIEHEGGLRSVITGVEGRFIDTKKISYRLGESIIFYKPISFDSSVSWHFSFYDMSNQRVINPASILPLSTDQESPIINSVLFQRVSDAKIIEADLQAKSFTQVVTPGMYRLVIEVFDFLNVKQISVRELEVFYDGYQIGHVYPGSFSVSKGVLMMNGTEKAVDDFIDLDGNWLVGPVNVQNGLHHLSIFVTDFSGNSINKEIFFEAKGDS